LPVELSEKKLKGDSVLDFSYSRQHPVATVISTTIFYTRSMNPSLMRGNTHHKRTASAYQCNFLQLSATKSGQYLYGLYQ
jgi:hypothetical protein